MKLNWLAIGVAISVFPAAGSAQDVVGSTIVDGHHVQLLSDHTWKYETPAASACQSIQDGVTFCGGSAGWNPTTAANKDIAAQFRFDDRNYGEFIVEKLGTEDGLNADLILSAVIGNAAKVANVQDKDIATVGPTPVTVDGMPGETLIYSLKIQNLPVVFTNTIVVDKHRAVQIVTYGIGPELTDEMKKNHENFLSATHLK